MTVRYWVNNVITQAVPVVKKKHKRVSHNVENLITQLEITYEKVQPKLNCTTENSLLLTCILQYFMSSFCATFLFVIHGVQIKRLEVHNSFGQTVEAVINQEHSERLRIMAYTNNITSYVFERVVDEC